jgi:hypothetical protein
VTSVEHVIRRECSRQFAHCTEPSEYRWNINDPHEQAQMPSRDCTATRGRTGKGMTLLVELSDIPR